MHRQPGSVADRRPLLEPRTHLVACLSFAVAGGALAACSDTGAEVMQSDGGVEAPEPTPTADASADDAATTPDASGDAAASGGATRLLVATSYVPRMIDLKTGQTTEVLANRLRWQQSPGHLYQHWDVSPDGQSIVVYHEYGTNAPAGDNRLVLYPIADATDGKVLVKTGGPLGEFTRAPCYADANTVYVLPTVGGVWKVDPTLDDAQTPTKVKDIPNGNQLNGPVVWNPDCSGFVAVGFRSGNTNASSDNVAYFSMQAGTLTQLSHHYGNNKGITLAQSLNLPSCGGVNCETAKNGGTAEKMGFSLDGDVWFDSNRDVWRTPGGTNDGEPKVLRVAPESGQEFAAMAALSTPRPRAVSRDGAWIATVNGNHIEVLDRNGERVVLSADDFNAANGPGFMRFID